MDLSQYYSATGDHFSFTREQASNFAKGVAGDFNPIHDVDSKRFCVPGDLLFTLAVKKLGLSQSMSVTFSDMVMDSVALHFNQTDDQHIDIVDDNGKTYLSIATDKNTSHDVQKALQLAEQYVAFSGKTFPHVLVPLWQQENVMVNPSRPLVIYQSMAIDLDRLDFDDLQLELTSAQLDVNGKRGQSTLQFEFKDGNTTIGRGEKRIVLSGLKPFDADATDKLVEFYEERKLMFA